jgi:hypothetical protein
LHAFLKLDKAVEGVVVRAPYVDSPSYPLKKLDVITQIGATPIDDEGMVKIANNLRVRFDYLVQKTAEDGTVALTVIRDGKTRVVQLPVSPDRRMLIPDLKGAYPSYFILGPIVFSTVTVQMLSSINQASVMGLAFVGNPGITRRGDAPAFEGEQLVVIAAPLFPHKLSQGYPVPIGWAVKSINGTMIKNLRHLVEVLRDAQSDFVTVEFYGRDIETFAFPRKETLAATDDILANNDIRAQGSADVLAIWNARPTK